MKHLLKMHYVQDEGHISHHLLAFKILFTIEQMRNPYLAHFLIADFIDDSEKGRFTQRNLKTILQKYFEYLISQVKLKQDNEEVSLQKMLE